MVVTPREGSVLLYADVPRLSEKLACYHHLVSYQIFDVTLEVLSVNHSGKVKHFGALINFSPKSLLQ